MYIFFFLSPSDVLFTAWFMAFRKWEWERIAIMFHVYAEAISWMDGYDDCGLNFAPQISINNFFSSLFLFPYIPIYVKLKWENAKEVFHTSLKDLLTIYCCCCLVYCYEGVQLRPLTGEKYVCIFIKYRNNNEKKYFFFSLSSLMIESHTVHTKKYTKRKNVIQQLIWTPFGSRHKLAPRNIQCFSTFIYGIGLNLAVWGDWLSEKIICVLNWLDEKFI